MDIVSHRRADILLLHCVHMDTMTLALATFWLSVGMGTAVTAAVIPLLKKMKVYKRTDRKKTLYGTEAVEFKKIREREEGRVKRGPVPRMGGLTLIPTVMTVGLLLSWFTGSQPLFIAVLTVGAVVLVMIYDDLADVGIIKRRPLRIRERLSLLGGITLISGLAFTAHIPNQLTFLPFSFFEQVSVGPVLLALLFAAWCIFWQVSSVIDGVDGLAGSIFLVLFTGTLFVSILEAHTDALLLSALGLGVLIPWLFANYAPAKAYLTETGITTLIVLFAIITFLLGTGEGSGSGLWIAGIFGTVLIATWVSNVLQLGYRKMTGKKLFQIAPLHHHFEALGIPGSAVVLRYMLVTFLCVILGISIVLL